MLFEKIQDLQKFKSYKEMTEKSEAFKQGLKDFKERKVKVIGGVKSFWIKQLISQREWNNYYSKHNTYCKLGIEGTGIGKKISIGFLVANCIPQDQDCQLCTNEELRQIDNYRRANNIMPYPFEEWEKRDESKEKKD